MREEGERDRMRIEHKKPRSCIALSKRPGPLRRLDPQQWSPISYMT